MSNKERFTRQVQLLLQILPFIAKYKELALKGGTAINLFIRNMPRLSVDIDLTYLPIKERSISLDEISKIFTKLQNEVEQKLPNVKGYIKNTRYVNAKQIIFENHERVSVKVEINHVLRGSVFEPVKLPLCRKAEHYFANFTIVNSLSFEDVYAGKICAALDRQHPRDLFDIKLLFDNEGISESLRQVFLIYLISNNRPIIELLNPNRINIEELYYQELDGMTEDPISYNDLLETRERLISEICSNLSINERLFLISIKDGSPDWSLLPFSGVENLPAIQWKLLNLNKMEIQKRKILTDKLKKFLEL